ncbi:uncharacterized protein LOC122032552 isoform X2 [Zingiber officinale]|uniref:uncharacterized protein LOC122032552 isoform X2 n=1 Tax=Zingiber officinale TaxID=94328 RepID=UPI001C4C02D8|nr:uncharacterized protein LOC122032552 isoform X2 [Zingiber officinale]
MELFTEDRDSGRSMSLRRRAKGDMATGHKDLRMLVVGGIARSRDFGGDSRWERLMMSTLQVRKIFVIRKAHGRSRRGGGMDAWYTVRCPGVQCIPGLPREIFVSLFFRLMMSTLLVRKIFVIRKAHGRSRRGGGMDALYCPLFGSAVHTGSTARDFRFFVFWMGNVEELLFLLINIY